MYDYGQRHYMPDIGKFNRIDRFSEKYVNHSPYSYTANNPIRFIDIKGDSIQVGKQYQQEINNILQNSFGKKSSNFSYTNTGMLVYNGNAKDFDKNEKKAFNELNALITSKTQYEVVIEQTFSVTKTDGTVLNIDTGQNGSMGDAAVYPTATKNGVGYIGLNPTPSNIKVKVVDVIYNDQGNQLPKNFADALNPPERTFTTYENFWHAIGHLRGGPTNQGKAMEVENMGGAIYKKVQVNADGSTTYTPASIPEKSYNLDHPKK